MTRVHAAAMLAACFTGTAQAQVTVSYADSRNFYSPEYAGYVASRGPIPTVVHNAPFGPGGAQAIATRMPVPGFLGRASFQAAGGPDALPYDRLVVAFDPAPGINAMHLRRGAYPTGEAALGAPALGAPDDPVLG